MSGADTFLSQGPPAATPVHEQSLSLAKSSMAPQRSPYDPDYKRPQVQQPPCSNCEELNHARFSDEFAEVKAVELLRRDRRLHQVETKPHHLNHTLRGDHCVPGRQSIIPQLKLEFSSFFRSLSIQQIMIREISAAHRYPYSSVTSDWDGVRVLLLILTPTIAPTTPSSRITNIFVNRLVNSACKPAVALNVNLTQRLVRPEEVIINFVRFDLDPVFTPLPMVEFLEYSPVTWLVTRIFRRHSCCFHRITVMRSIKPYSKELALTSSRAGAIHTELALLGRIMTQTIAAASELLKREHLKDNLDVNVALKHPELWGIMRHACQTRSFSHIADLATGSRCQPTALTAVACSGHGERHVELLANFEQPETAQFYAGLLSRACTVPPLSPAADLVPTPPLAPHTHPPSAQKRLLGFTDVIHHGQNYVRGDAFPSLHTLQPDQSFRATLRVVLLPYKSRSLLNIVILAATRVPRFLTSSLPIIFRSPPLPRAAFGDMVGVVHPPGRNAARDQRPPPPSPGRRILHELLNANILSLGSERSQADMMEQYFISFNGRSRRHMRQRIPLSCPTYPSPSSRIVDIRCLVTNGEVTDMGESQGPARPVGARKKIRGFERGKAKWRSLQGERWPISRDTYANTAHQDS
ncbi:hypothetical protein EDD22DRAFT_842487 [Suillus occidentalis]|nr:hypothetical protein EDD22DRAFT_842487 [Suillus occidentalis]